jgi:ribosomal protein L11 methylase PrmA
MLYCHLVALLNKEKKISHGTHHSQAAHQFNTIIANVIASFLSLFYQRIIESIKRIQGIEDFDIQLK